MKKIAVLTQVLKGLISLVGGLMLLGWLIAPSAWAKPLSYLVTIFLPYVPDLFRLARVQFSSQLVLAYEFFLIIALVLGIDLNWYSEMLVTAAHDSYYDKIVHFASGILVAVAGQELFNLYQQQNQSTSRPVRWFQVLYLFGCVALVAVGWECFEFLYDQIGGGHMQELVKSGVADTMWDMIAALIGGGICILLLVNSANKRNSY